MPFRLDVCRDQGFVRTRVTGTVTLDDIRAHLTEVSRLGATQLPSLVDVRRVETVTLTLRDLLSLARAAREALGDVPIAPRAVVVDCRRHFEWARTFASLVAGWMSVGVFAEREEAERWLDHRTRQVGTAPPQLTRAAGA